MMYSRSNRKEKTKYRYLFLSLFILLVLFTPFLHTLYRWIEKPLILAYQNTEQMKRDGTSLFALLSSKKRLIDENINLREQLKEKENIINQSSFLSSSHEAEEKISQFKKNLIVVPVVKKTKSGIFVISQGERNSLREGSNVYDSHGILIGFLGKVFPESSQVFLFSKKGVERDAVLFPTSVSLTLIGEGNGMLAEVQRDVSVAKGDIIFDQEESGFPIGIVVSVDFDPRNPTKKVYVSPLSPYDEIQFVGVEPEEK